MTRDSHEILQSGTWTGGATWELFLADTLPPNAAFTSVACVALRDLNLADPNAQEVVMTYNASGRGTDGPGSWEVPGGHLDPLDPDDPHGPQETLEQALAREALEEAGFVIAKLGLFGYRKVTNPPDPPHDEVTYSPFYWATTDEPLRAPTDPEKPLACGSFRLDVLARFVPVDAIQKHELQIVQLGVEAAHRAARDAA